VQVDDKSKLDYEAGQDEAEDGKQEPKEGPHGKKDEDKAKAQPEGEVEDEEEGSGGREEVNEDADDKYEDRQYAAPQVCRMSFYLTFDSRLSACCLCSDFITAQYCNISQIPKPDYLDDHLWCLW
jgi:hypothetical protein